MKAAVFLGLVASAAAQLSFLNIGDWGGNSDTQPTTPVEIANARAMAAFATRLNTSHVLMLGDNFYQNGVTSDSSPRFKTTFEDVFVDAPFAYMPFYVVAGNHDARGSVDAQVSYTAKSTKWKMPARYYSFTVRVSAQSTAKFIMIDTVLISGFSYHNRTTGVFLPPTGAPDRKAADDQIQWIEDELKTATDKYIFIAGHYPVYSGCSHGNDNEMIRVLRPLLIEHRVTAYISGHEHCSEHLIEPGLQQPVYLIAGMGKECCYAWTNAGGLPSGSLQWYIANGNKGSIQGAYMGVTLTDALATAVFTDTNGNDIRVVSMPPRS